MNPSHFLGVLSIFVIADSHFKIYFGCDPADDQVLCTEMFPTKNARKTENNQYVVYNQPLAKLNILNSQLFEYPDEGFSDIYSNLSYVPSLLYFFRSFRSQIDIHQTLDIRYVANKEENSQRSGEPLCGGLL